MTEVTQAGNVATFFLQAVDTDKGDLMTNLRLQKLLYYPQAWHLANFDSPLFPEDFEAWIHGPVIPSVWKTYRRYGWKAIPPTDPADATTLPEESQELLDEVWEVYGRYSARQLESMTHEDPTWRAARGDAGPGDICDTIMPKDAIKAYYRSQLDGQ